MVWAPIGKGKTAWIHKPSRNPAPVDNAFGVTCKHNLEALFVMRTGRGFCLFRRNESQILQDSIDVAGGRDREAELLGMEMDPGATLGEMPANESTAFDGCLEPDFVSLRDIKVEEDFQQRILLPGELTHL